MGGSLGPELPGLQIHVGTARWSVRIGGRLVAKCGGGNERVREERGGNANEFHPVNTPE